LLQGAINRFFKKNIGGVQTRFSAVLPDAPESRERFLTRSEAAKLLWTAWRARKETKLLGSKGRLTSQHIARYILVGLYTGSRNGDICGAAIIPTIGRGYVDLERGIFRRRPDNKKETSKRRPTIPLPPKLLAHMRRWQRLGISKRAVIEFNGKPITRVRDGWETLVEKAGLATDDPRRKIVRHTLRHTAITWYLSPDRRTGRKVDIETVSQYCGVSERVIRDTYRHVMASTFDEIMGASRNFGR
jgi:integrase